MLPSTRALPGHRGPAGVPHDLTKYLVLLAALPSGFFGLLIGAGYGAKSEVASSSLIVRTVLSILTLPIWIIYLNGLK